MFPSSSTSTWTRKSRTSGWRPSRDKAGLHTSANARRAGAYEHIPPDTVGNGSRVVVSELSGRATIETRAKELGVTLDSGALEKILDALKQLEYAGYHFEVADGSLELSMRAAADGSRSTHRPFEIESFRVITDWIATISDGDSGDRVSDLVHPWGTSGRLTTEATVKVRVGEDRVVSTAEGNGPVNALDAAIRQAIGKHFPELAEIRLTDYRVRVLDSHRGTGAITRVLDRHRWPGRLLVDDGRLGEHHRGFVAGPRRLACLWTSAREPKRHARRGVK